MQGDDKTNQKDSHKDSMAQHKDSGFDSLAKELARVSLESQSDFFRVVDSTRFLLDAQPQSLRGSGAEVTLDHVGGVKDQINKLKELLDLHFKQTGHTQQGNSLSIILFQTSFQIQ